MTIELNEFQREVNDSIESFWQAAQGKRGRVMDKRSVFLLATYVSGLTEAVIGLENQLGSVQNMLAAYVEQYGNELFDTLTSPPVVEGEIVDQTNVELETNSSEGVVVDDDTQESDGQATEESGVDSSPSTEEPRPVSEDQNEDE